MYPNSLIRGVRYSYNFDIDSQRVNIDSGVAVVKTRDGIRLPYKIVITHCYKCSHRYTGDVTENSESESYLFLSLYGRSKLKEASTALLYLIVHYQVSK